MSLPLPPPLSPWRDRNRTAINTSAQKEKVGVHTHHLFKAMIKSYGARIIRSLCTVIEQFLDQTPILLFGRNLLVLGTIRNSFLSILLCSVPKTIGRFIILRDDLETGSCFLLMQLKRLKVYVKLQIVRGSFSPALQYLSIRLSQKISRGKNTAVSYKAKFVHTIKTQQLHS